MVWTVEGGEPVRTYGALTGSAIGSLMKDVVSRAIREIRTHRFNIEVTPKENPLKPGKPDYYTKSDTEAQAIYVRLLQERFPGFGIIAEEADFTLPCTIPGHTAYFTVDPLDGTRMFMRKPSHSVGSLLALVWDGVIIAAIVADVFSDEMYYYRPDSAKTHRLTSTDHDLLQIDQTLVLAEQYAIIREDPRLHSRFAQAIIGEPLKHGLVKNWDKVSGSFGSMMGRLCKGEVGIAILAPGHNTPWDLTPPYGILERLGFVFLTINAANGVLERWTYTPSTKPVQVSDELLVIHHSRIAELNAFYNKRFPDCGLE